MSMKSDFFSTDMTPRPAQRSVFTEGGDGTGAGADPVDGFAPDITIQTQDATIANLKPADSNWDHCNIRNDYGNKQEG